MWIYFKPLNEGEITSNLTFSYQNAASHTRTAAVALKHTAEGSADLTPIIHSFSALPVALTLGNSTTLSWSVTDADSLSIDQGVGDVIGTSITVTPETTGTVTYTLTATNSFGESTATATVTVSSGTTPEIDPSPYAVSVAESLEMPISTGRPASFRHASSKSERRSEKMRPMGFSTLFVKPPANGLASLKSLKVTQSDSVGLSSGHSRRY